MGLDGGPSHQGGKQRPFMTQQSQKQMRQEEWAVPSNHLENNLVRALLSGSAVPEAPLALPAPTQVQDQRALDSPATLV